MNFFYKNINKKKKEKRLFTIIIEEIRDLMKKNKIHILKVIFVLIILNILFSIFVDFLLLFASHLASCKMTALLWYISKRTDFNVHVEFCLFFMFQVSCIYIVMNVYIFSSSILILLIYLACKYFKFQNYLVSFKVYI